MVSHVVLLTRVWRWGLVNIVLIQLVGFCMSSINILVNIFIIWGRGDGTAEVKLGEVGRELGTRQLGELDRAGELVLHQARVKLLQLDLAEACCLRGGQGDEAVASLHQVGICRLRVTQLRGWPLLQQVRIEFHVNLTGKLGGRAPLDTRQLTRRALDHQLGGAWPHHWVEIF